MAFHNILSKADRALVAYLVNLGAGTTADVWPAKRSEDKFLPCTICWSHSAKPCDGVPYSGVYEVEAFIEVRTPGVIEENQTADEPRQSSDDRVAAAFDCFFQNVDSSGEKLGEAITLAGRGSGQTDLSDFTVLNCRVVDVNQGFNSRIKEQRGNAWIDVLHLELTCCPSDVL